jgi:SET domain
VLIDEDEDGATLPRGTHHLLRKEPRRPRRSSSAMECDNDDELPVESEWFRIEVGSKGRGLFAAKPIPPHTLLHVAPCLLVPATEYDRHMRHTLLEHYLFNGPGGNKLLALGYGSLLNHSRRPNVDYRVDAGRQIITYRSGPRPVERGDELCISYGSDLWFDDAEDGDDNNDERGKPSAELEDDDDEDEKGNGSVGLGFLGRIQLSDHDISAADDEQKQKQEGR